jgi:predicted nucleic acid-binding Zn ribbon protein
MPMFNYRCTGCGCEYETLIMSDWKPYCPNCNADEEDDGIKQEKLVSAPRMFNGDLTDNKPSIKE